MTPDEIRGKVRELYAEVDAEVAAAGPKCDASGRCCRFKEWNHVLYLTSFEADVLLKSAPPFAGPVTPDFCPFQVENLCTAREPRPLGCRIYFCDPAYEGVGERIMESALTKLKRLADEHDLPWRYASLHVFLQEAPTRPSRSDTPPIARQSLPMIDRRQSTPWAKTLDIPPRGQETSR